MLPSALAILAQSTITPTVKGNWFSGHSCSLCRSRTAAPLPSRAAIWPSIERSAVAAASFPDDHVDHGLKRTLNRGSPLRNVCGAFALSRDPTAREKAWLEVVVAASRRKCLTMTYKIQSGFRTFALGCIVGEWAGGFSKGGKR